MFIDRDRADYALGQLVMVALKIKDELRHGAAGAGAGSKNQDLIGTLKCFGDRLIEGLEFRLSLTVRFILVVVQRATKAVGVIGRDVLGHGAVEIGFVNAGLAVVDDHQEMDAIGPGLGLWVF